MVDPRESPPGSCAPGSCRREQDIMSTKCEMVSPTMTPTFCLILAGIGFKHNQYLHTDMVEY